MAKTIPAEEKVFMVSKSTNTTYSGSAALKAMQEWYTMDDVTNTVRPYQVFTALLTQSGDNDPRSIPSDTNSLIKGRTYEIVSVGAGEDMTLYGAPNNNPGTYFMCTVDTEVFTSELNYNQGAPVATVLENTIGNIWFSYDGVGVYNVNSDGLFILGKSWTPTIQIFNDTAGLRDGEACEIRQSTSNQYFIATYNQSGTTIDNQLNNTPIEIRVYN